MIGVSFAVTGAAKRAASRAVDGAREEQPGRVSLRGEGPRRSRVPRRRRRESRRVRCGNYGGCRHCADGRPRRRAGRGRHGHGPSWRRPLADVLPEREALACRSCGLEGQRLRRHRCACLLRQASRRRRSGRHRRCRPWQEPFRARSRSPPMTFAGRRGLTDLGADCRAGVEGVGAAAGNGAGGRGGSSVSGST